MPSMTTSHGGILYYVVKVPKEETPAPQQQEPWYPDKPSATSTPLSKQHESTDSGWDNPFRPDGDLSREADEIVEMINSGKPITPTPLNGDAPKLPESNENGQVNSPTKLSPLNATPKGANGTKAISNGDKPGQVELQRATVVQPGDASQVEHVNLKKKPKCKCCVIQ